MSIGFNKKSTAMDIMKPAAVPIPINANTQIVQQPNIVVQKKQPAIADPELPKLDPMPNVSSAPPNENKNIAADNVDHSKNVEIRRMSATDDGDKVLESAWDSPEKETKTPLQMVQSIVSQIEDVKPPASAPVVKIQPVAAPAPASMNQPQPPAWTQGTGQRPLLHSQKQVVNDTPPSSKPLPNLVPPQQRNTAQASAPPQNNVTTIMAPAPAPAATHFMPVSGPAAGGHHVMQLVNTINGPMLMQAAMPAPQPQSIATVPAELQDPKLMQGSAGKGGKKTQAEQQLNTPTAIQYQTQGGGGAAMPILVSPNTMMATGQQASPNGPAQHVLIAGHPAAGTVGMIQGTPQFVLNQPTMIAPNQVFLSSNGTLVAMPAAPPQGVIYNQLPDGTLVQVQSPTMIHHQPAPQTILTAANGQQVMINSAAGHPAQQLSPNAGHHHHHGQIQFQAAPSAGVGPTYIMTPSGLVQTSPVPVQQVPVTATTPATTAGLVHFSAPPPMMTTSGMMTTTQLEPQPGPSSAAASVKFRKESTTTDKSEDTDEDDDDDEDSDDRDDNESIGDVQLVLQMDEDSSEDEIPLAKKAKVSPTSSTGGINSSSTNIKSKFGGSVIGVPKQTKNSSPKTYIQSTFYKDITKY